jgi:hypothetical protein
MRHALFGHFLLYAILGWIYIRIQSLTTLHGPDLIVALKIGLKLGYWFPELEGRGKIIYLFICWVYQDLTRT